MLGPPTPYRPGPRFPSLTTPAQDLAERSKAAVDRALMGMPRLAATDWLPPVDVVEDDSGFTVTAEVAGMASANIDLNVADGVLTIRGRREGTIPRGVRHWYRAEVPNGTFERVLPIGPDIDDRRVEATLADGLLTVRLQKREDRVRKSRKIPIRG